MSEGHEPAAGGADDTGEAADRLLDKLHDFVQGLEPDERALFAALLAPGVAQAYLEPTAADVTGFTAESLEGWSPTRLPEALRARVRAGRLRVELE